MTATQLAYRAARDLGSLRAGQTLGTDVLNDIHVELNDMVDSWLLDELMVFSEQIDAYNLTAGLQTYTIGPTQLAPNFTAPRPTSIQYANVILNTVTPVVRTPVEIVTVQKWASIAVQNIPLAIPLVLFYDRDFDPTSGFGTLRIWPGPQVNYQLELYTWQQLQRFADLITNYRFPPGYELAIRKNLAVQIAPLMEISSKIAKTEHPRKDLLPLLIKQASDSKAAIQSYNAPQPLLAGDPAFMSEGGGAFNYSIGTTGTGNR